MPWFTPPPLRPKPAMPEAYDASGLRPHERRRIAFVFWFLVCDWVVAALIAAGMLVWAFGAAWPTWARAATGGLAAAAGALLGAGFGHAVGAAIAQTILARRPSSHADAS